MSLHDGLKVNLAAVAQYALSFCLQLLLTFLDSTMSVRLRDNPIIHQRWLEKLASLLEHVPCTRQQARTTIGFNSMLMREEPSRTARLHL
jgi:hypothetical protein